MADQNNFLEMSDEDIMNMTDAPASGGAPAGDDGADDAAAAAQAEVEALAAKEAAQAEADAAADASERPDGGTLPDEGDKEEGSAGGTPEEPADEVADDGQGTDAEGAKDEKTPESGEKPAEETKPEEKPAVVDYKAEYEKLLAPFKANGREVSVGSVDDAIALMQMGANYNKKMAALKPNLRLLKLLDNNGLLSEERISYLIELANKKPDAINKLVKDSGLNPMDLDPDKAGDYKPTIQKVDEREMALDTVLDELQDSKAYTRTMQIVSKELDLPSKNIIADNPQLLKVINDHVERGIYDLISAEVEREKMFGRLSGMSDLEAYRQVGDTMNARGAFNHLGSSQGKTPAEPRVVVQPKPKKVDEDALNAKRRAASPSKPATPVSTPASADFNPLAMSDEEFAKAADGRFR